MPTKAQQMMIEDGLPAELALLTEEERRADWKGVKLSKPRDLKAPPKDEDPATKALRKEMAKVAERKKAERFARLKALKATTTKQAAKPAEENDMATKKTAKKAAKAAPNARRTVGTRKKAAAKPHSAPSGAVSAALGVRPGTKLEIIAGLLTRPGGCTMADVLKATGWPAVSMPQQAKAAGLVLSKEKVDGKTVYRAEKAA